jgi:hypothetical protein
MLVKQDASRSLADGKELLQFVPANKPCCMQQPHVGTLNMHAATVKYSAACINAEHADAAVDSHRAGSQH